jgi:AbrB family looped-hinge helix DNA binding protein
MNAIVSKLTSKGQATIPKAIRNELQIKSGDQIAFHVKDGHVEISRVDPLDIEFAKAQEAGLSKEWMAAEDEAAYGDL